MLGVIFLAALLNVQKGGVEVTLDAVSAQIDPGRSTLVTLSVRTPSGVTVSLPDLRSRVEGFSLAEDFEQEPVRNRDGSVVQTAEWRLVPEPCAETYRIRPFVVGEHWFGPVKFEPPPAREPVTGEMEIAPTKDLPPLSWHLVGYLALGLVALALVVAALWFGLRYLARRVKEHRMSPIERAWVELDRLLKKGLPGRGRYKDYYVELTMVVRRYIQRKYGIKAPHLTTEEFLREFKSEELAKFLESADLVKFAGVEATPEMADDAADSARTYLKSDSIVKEV